MEKVKHRNGVRYPFSIKERARELRQHGKTHREIVRELGISLGSADLWTKDIILTAEQKLAIWERYSAKVFTPERREQLRTFASQTGFLREKYTKLDLIEKIRNFYKIHGRIPLKREFNMYDQYKRRFGSWNRAIKASGFSTNPELFSYKFCANDGHRCDSFTEKIIDDWLLNRGIPHARNFRYGETKMTADFMIQPNIILEFFGLAGVQKIYDEIITRKRKFCQEFNFRLVEIYPKDLFPKNRLAEILVTFL